MTIVQICNAALQLFGAKRISSLDEGSRESDAAAFYWDLVRPYVFRSVPWKCISKRVVLQNAALTGTAAVAELTPTAVAGTVTLFAPAVVAGDRIRLGAEERIVEEVGSNTALTVTEAFEEEYTEEKATLVRQAPNPAWGFAYAWYLPGDYVRLVSLRQQDAEYREVDGLLHTRQEAPAIEYVYHCMNPDKYSPDLVRALYLNMAYEMAYCLTQNPEIGDRIKADLEKFFLPIARFNNSVGAGLEIPKADTLTDLFL